MKGFYELVFLVFSSIFEREHLKQIKYYSEDEALAEFLQSEQQDLIHQLDLKSAPKASKVNSESLE